jgi:hypothetical protein
MTRYFFPAYVAVYLSTAYTLGKKIEQKSNIWLIILGLIFSISIVSNIISGNSETWWNKVVSYQNPAIANLINKAENPLVIAEKFDINEGNIISLSHKLKPNVKLQLLDIDTPVIAYENFTDIYIFNPSPELITEIEKIYQAKVVKVYNLLYKVSSK